jgi:acetyl esterase/lipase
MSRQREQFLALVGPRGFHGIGDLTLRRRRYAEVMSLAASRAPDDSQVSRRDHTVPRAGRPGLPVRSYHPVGLPPGAPGVLYVHGGGMIMGSVTADDGLAATLAVDVGAVVVSVEYGLAPENPGAGPVEDCYAALCWLAARAGDLGIAADRLAVFGASAGGGLACGLALLARDRNGPPLRQQTLAYPMLDDRNTTASSHAITDLGIWDRAANLEAWNLLLDGEDGGAGVSPYVAPARADDLTGLPPTYVDVGDLDLFLDEDLDLVRRLSAAGVPVELHVHPGAFHGFDQMAPGSGAARAARSTRAAALRRALQTPTGTSHED